VRPLEARTPKPKIMIRGMEGRGRVQLIGTAGVVGGHDEFSLC